MQTMLFCWSLYSMYQLQYTGQFCAHASSFYEKDIYTFYLLNDDPSTSPFLWYVFSTSLKFPKGYLANVCLSLSLLCLSICTYIYNFYWVFSFSLARTGDVSPRAVVANTSSPSADWWLSSQLFIQSCCSSAFTSTAMRLLSAFILLLYISYCVSFRNLFCGTLALVCADLFLFGATPSRFRFRPAALTFCGTV